MRMNFCPYSAPLQCNTHPAHQVRVQSAVETQARTRGTIRKSTVPNRSVQLSGNEAIMEVEIVKYNLSSNNRSLVF